MQEEYMRKLDQAVRKFSDSMFINHNKDIFLIGILSGGAAESYVVTPAHAKGILNALAQHVTSYEKEFGVIDMSQPSLLSPIQGEDLKK